MRDYIGRTPEEGVEAAIAAVSSFKYIVGAIVVVEGQPKVVVEVSQLKGEETRAIIEAIIEHLQHCSVSLN